MFGFLKKLFHQNAKATELSDDGHEKYYEIKQAALEKILGNMHDFVGHAIVPFKIGGAVDMYYFPHALSGTAFVTMELMEPDGSGPMPGNIGTYELIAFTKHAIDNNASNDVEQSSAFNKIERRICGIFTGIADHSRNAIMNPGNTCEVPAGEKEKNRCLIFDEYKKDGIDFDFDGQKHGLLLCIEIFPQEMRYAMEKGGPALLDKLKAKGYYPYSDLDREPIV